jgi:hypothetical protein
MHGPMTPHKDSAPDEKPPREAQDGSRSRLLKCPHCGRLVAVEAPPGRARRSGSAAQASEGRAGETPSPPRCPSCGLEIKERHLA